MRKSGQVRPMFLFLSSTGSVLSLPVSIENSKSAWVNLARVVSIAHGATAVAFIGGGCISHSTGIRPSEASEREGGVVIIGETYTDGKRKSVVIKCALAESFSRIQCSKLVVSEEAQGPFANILPSKLSTPKLQAEGKRLLRKIGITDESLQRRC